MKKIVLSLILTLICIGSAVAQFDAQFSQYMFHTSSFNPAAVGEGDMIQLTGQHRIQWIGMPNGGQTTAFSFNSPLRIAGVNQGIGISFLNDRVGQFSNQSAHLQYAFKKSIGLGVLSVGAELGFVSLGFRGDSVSAHKISLGDYHDIENDTEIPKTAVAGMGFDMSLGVFYSTPSFYTGISYLHLNRPTVDWGELNKFRLDGSMFVTGGYNWKVPESKFVFKPSTLIKTDFASWQIDLTARAEYDSKYWGGITYRLEDAVVVLLGINIAGGLSIGYSYDLPTTQILTVSSGSHEIMLQYSFEYVFGNHNSRYKSIRFL